MNEFIPNAAITSMARQTLKGRWFKTAAILFGLIILECIIDAILKGIFSGIYFSCGRGIYSLFEVFMTAFMLLWWFKMVKYNDDNFDHSNEALKKFGSFAGVGILSGLIVFIGYIFFIIPGIILQFSYALVFWLIADDPAMPVIDALKLSRKMMYGYKWKLFCLNCRFIGWWLLSIFTLGIGLLFVIPYQVCANIHFYRNVKAAYEAQNGEIQPTEYQGMSTLNNILLAVLIFVWNAGVVYTIFLLKNMA